MKHLTATVTAMLGALTLACLWGCSSGEPGHDAAFWKTAKCPQLNGLRFRAQYYMDNQKTDTDVLWIHNDTLFSERWMGEGFRTTFCACQDHGVGTIRIKATMLNAHNASRIWNFTIKGGKLDGMMSKVEEGGDYVIHPFAGEEMP